MRTEPLILARGRLEKLAMAGGAINVFVKRLEPLVTPDQDVAGVVELAERRVAAAASEAAGGPQRGGRGPERDPGRLPGRRPGRAELRVRTPEVGMQSRAARTSNLPPA